MSRPWPFESPNHSIEGKFKLIEANIRDVKYHRDNIIRLHRRNQALLGEARSVAQQHGIAEQYMELFEEYEGRLEGQCK